MLQGETVRGRSSALIFISAASIAVSLVGAAVAIDPASDERAFRTENAAAMQAMMEGMEITPSGDVDSDFARMMIPHHQGAINMAKAELRYGRNERLRRLAQEIIITQTQEIEALGAALQETNASGGSPGAQRGPHDVQAQPASSNHPSKHHAP
jgi:hypothetical protein